MTLALLTMLPSTRDGGVWAVVDSAREILRPSLAWLGNRTQQNPGDPPGHSSGNVLVDRAMPALSGRVGHLGLGRQADSRAGSSPLANGGGSGGRRGHVFSARPGPAGTDLGRLAIAGHAAGGRPGGSQTATYRGAVSPGRPGRLPPGVGDRPCRGSCASGSRSGQSSDCGSRGPSLAGRNWCCSPARSQRPSIIACSAKAERLGLRIGQPLAEAKALLPKAVFLPADAAADR